MVNGTVIFSKLQTGQFPNPDKVSLVAPLSLPYICVLIVSSFFCDILQVVVNHRKSAVFHPFCRILAINHRIYPPSRLGGRTIHCTQQTFKHPFPLSIRSRMYHWERLSLLNGLYELLRHPCLMSWNRTKSVIKTCWTILNYIYNPTLIRSNGVEHQRAS